MYEIVPLRVADDDFAHTQKQQNHPAIQDIETITVSELWDHAWKKLTVAWKSLLEDLKTAGWRRCIDWFVILAWLVALILTFYYLVKSSTTKMVGKGCKPGGTFFSESDRSWSYWSRAGWFQITLGGGRLSFPQAKAVDVAWDLVS